MITNEDEKENFACGEHKQRKFIGVFNFLNYSIASEQIKDLTCYKFIKMEDNYLESNVKVLLVRGWGEIHCEHPPSSYLGV